MSTEPLRDRVNSVIIEQSGHTFRVTERADALATFDFDWLSGPPDRGFTSARNDRLPLSHDEMRQAIRSFLSGS